MASKRTKNRLYTVEDRGYETPCHIWQGALFKDGYGQLWTREEGRRVLRRAHRVFYEQEKGPIPEGWHAHHKCEVLACVNSEHIEPMSPEDHYRLHYVERTHFGCGHERTPENTYMSKNGDRSGKRYPVCRTCRIEKSRLYRVRKQEERGRGK